MCSPAGAGAPGSSTSRTVDDGQAVFVAPRFVDGETLDAPASTRSSLSSAVKRTAFAEERGTTLVAVGGAPGKAYEAHGWEIWAPLVPSTEPAQGSPTALDTCSPTIRRIR